MTAPSVPMHEPQVVTDGGPWAMHDVACAVCQLNKAILNLNLFIFEPCNDCTADGWQLKRLPRWLRWRR